MSLGRTILCLDVGGSSIKSGLLKGDVVSKVKKTPIDSRGSREHIISDFKAIITSYMACFKLDGIAFSMPGPFEYEHGVFRIKGVNKFESLYGLNIGRILREEHQIKCPFSFRNDAECAVLGEAEYGVGKDFEKMVGITLGTGFGSCFIERGTPLVEGTGVPENGWLYEEYWNGNRIDDLFSIRGLQSYLAEHGFEGDPKKAAGLVDEHEAIAEAFQRWGRDLGRFLAYRLVDFAPEAVLVLGGLSGAFPIYGESLRTEMTIPVLVGELNEKAPFFGAAEKLRQIHFADGD
ncbi:ROK family protein [Flagellimonas sp. DF-77]|uniref:ROK family protein n=1 Tax=Flagellimonas algarum TaxID=3230298 RepID=UPI0033920FAC